MMRPSDGTGAEAQISVVICANSDQRFELLRQAISSAQRQSYPPLEVIAVIDHNDGMLKRLSDAATGATVVANSHEKGLSGARNTGIECARGTIIAFLDDDASAHPSWLEEMARCFADQAVVGMGGHVAPVLPEGRLPRWFPEEFLWVIGCSYRGLPQNIAEIRNPIGCNMAFLKAGLEKSGLFAPGLGRQGNNAAGCEETDLAIRLRNAIPGSKIIHNPACQVDHHIDPGRATWGYFLRRCRSEGRSKAMVVARNGAETGLQSERGYVVRTLSAALGRGIADGIFRGDPFGFLRAVAVTCGLGVTAFAYVTQRVRQKFVET